MCVVAICRCCFTYTIATAATTITIFFVTSKPFLRYQKLPGFLHEIISRITLNPFYIFRYCTFHLFSPAIQLALQTDRQCKVGLQQNTFANFWKTSQNYIGTNKIYPPFFLPPKPLSLATSLSPLSRKCHVIPRLNAVIYHHCTHTVPNTGKIGEELTHTRKIIGQRLSAT